MVKTRIEVLPDIEGHIDFFEALPDYDTDMYIHKKMKTTKESSLEVLKELLPVLEAQMTIQMTHFTRSFRLCGRKGS